AEGCGNLVRTVSDHEGQHTSAPPGVGLAAAGSMGESRRTELPIGSLVRTVATPSVATLLQVMVVASGEQQSFRKPAPISAGRPSGCGACVEWDGDAVRTGTAGCAGCKDRG